MWYVLCFVVCLLEDLFDEFIVGDVDFFFDCQCLYIVYLIIVDDEVLYGCGEFVFGDVEEVCVFVVGEYEGVFVEYGFDCGQFVVVLGCCFVVYCCGGGYYLFCEFVCELFVVVCYECDEIVDYGVVFFDCDCYGVGVVVFVDLIGEVWLFGLYCVFVVGVVVGVDWECFDYQVDGFVYGLYFGVWVEVVGIGDFLILGYDYVWCFVVEGYCYEWI